MTLHPTVPNPYTLLSLLPTSAKNCTYLDLKDAFCIHLTLVSQPIFAFENAPARPGLPWSCPPA